MSNWLLEASNGKTREFDTRAEAESVKADFENMGLSVTITRQAPASDGGEVVIAEEPPEDDGDMPVRGGDSSVIEDPLNWIPNDFVDTIEGTLSIKRKGYAVLAERYNISVTAAPVILPHNTEFEYAMFRAIAETEDGQTYSGFGTAHVDRGDDKVVLAEMAETRALKRATAWASGVGMTAVAEMQAGTVERGDER